MGEGTWHQLWAFHACMPAIRCTYLNTYPCPLVSPYIFKYAYTCHTNLKQSSFLCSSVHIILGHWVAWQRIFYGVCSPKVDSLGMVTTRVELTDRLYFMGTKARRVLSVCTSPESGSHTEKICVQWTEAKCQRSWTCVLFTKGAKHGCHSSFTSEEQVTSGVNVITVI